MTPAARQWLTLVLRVAALGGFVALALAGASGGLLFGYVVFAVMLAEMT